MERKKNCTDINVEKKYHCTSKRFYRYSSVFDTEKRHDHYILKMEMENRLASSQLKFIIIFLMSKKMTAYNTYHKERIIKSKIASSLKTRSKL